MFHPKVQPISSPPWPTTKLLVHQFCNAVQSVSSKFLGIMWFKVWRHGLPQVPSLLSKRAIAPSQMILDPCYDETDCRSLSVFLQRRLSRISLRCWFFSNIQVVAVEPKRILKDSNQIGRVQPERLLRTIQHGIVGRLVDTRVHSRVQKGRFAVATWQNWTWLVPGCDISMNICKIEIGRVGTRDDSPCGIREGIGLGSNEEFEWWVYWYHNDSVWIA